MTGTGSGVDWRAAAFATGPGDEAYITQSIRAAYAAAALDAPARVAWLPSPLHGAVAAVLVSDPAARTAMVAAGLGGHVELAEEALSGCQPGAPVRELVRTRPWAAARAAAHADLGPAQWARAWALNGALWDQVNGIVAGIKHALGDVGRLTSDDTAAGRRSEDNEAGPVLRRATLGAVLGQHDAPWLGLFARLGRLDGLHGLAGVAAQAGWWWPYKNLAIVTQRPAELHREESGRLHRADGPALAYPGGFVLHAWRGMPMPADFIASLGNLSPARIAQEPNAELRRVMLEVYGFDRYLADTGATPVDRDVMGVLWRIDLPGDEPAVMVEVVNATPEPDGTRRTYWLRVPPQTRTAKEGVAWTFGLDPAGYRPLVQT
jgi:uncharacterized protein DUF6745